MSHQIYIDPSLYCPFSALYLPVLHYILPPLCFGDPPMCMKHSSSSSLWSSRLYLFNRASLKESRLISACESTMVSSKAFKALACTWKTLDTPINDLTQKILQKKNIFCWSFKILFCVEITCHAMMRRNELVTRTKLAKIVQPQAYTFK